LTTTDVKDFTEITAALQLFHQKMVIQNHITD